MEKGKQIIARAIESKESGNITLNQVDAYGIIIYYKGKVQRSMVGDVSSWTSNYKTPEPYNISEGMVSKYKRFSETEGHGTHKGWAKRNIPDGTGFEWAKMFVREFRKTGEVPQTGFALVVFNAAFYSKIQEDGASPLKRSYKVISQIVGDLEDAGKDFKGSSVRLYNL